MTWYGWGSPVGIGLFIVAIDVFLRCCTSPG
jgi:hypothetical protein